MRNEIKNDYIMTYASERLQKVLPQYSKICKLDSVFKLPISTSLTNFVFSYVVSSLSCGN